MVLEALMPGEKPSVAGVVKAGAPSGAIITVCVTPLPSLSLIKLEE